MKEIISIKDWYNRKTGVLRAGKQREKRGNFCLRQEIPADGQEFPQFPHNSRTEMGLFRCNARRVGDFFPILPVYVLGGGWA